MEKLKEEIKEKLVSRIGQISVADFNASSKNWQVYKNATNQVVDLIAEIVKQAFQDGGEYKLLELQGKVGVATDDAKRRSELQDKYN